MCIFKIWFFALEKRKVFYNNKLINYNYLHAYPGKVFSSTEELNNFSIFIVISLFISIILPLLSFLLTRRIITREKLSLYECGFEPFGIERVKVTIHFYLIAILFLVFDLEVVFLFPWCFVINILGNQAFWSMVYFFFILLVGFVYEWRRGALEW